MRKCQYCEYKTPNSICPVCGKVTTEIETEVERNTTVKYNKEDGYSWGAVMNRADELFEMLHKEKFSSQDIAHIGLRLTHTGNFAWVLDGVKYAQEKKTYEGRALKSTSPL